MSEIGRIGRLLYALGVGLFAVALIAGAVQSLRINGRLPSIDLLRQGGGAYVNLLVAQHDYDKAIQELEMQARLPPADAVTHQRLGKLLGSQRRPEEARAHFQEAVRLRPDDAEGYCFLGFTYIDTNEPDLATRYLTEAARLNPRLPSAFYGLGIAWAQQGELARAEKCFAKAVELAPQDPNAQLNLDKVRQKLRASTDGPKKGEPSSPVD